MICFDRVEIILAIVFVIFTFTKRQNKAAVFEWIIALIFTFYVLTFFIDLLPASRSKQENTNQVVLRELEMENGRATVNGYDEHPAAIGWQAKPMVGAAQNF